eukprot:15446475-Alexandrium_andersonii.AAC.1
MGGGGAVLCVAPPMPSTDTQGLRRPSISSPRQGCFKPWASRWLQPNPRELQASSRLEPWGHLEPQALQP